MPASRTLCSVLFLTLATGSVPASDDVGVRVQRILEEWRRDADTPDEQVTKALVACGAAAVPHLCAVLEDPKQRLPAVAMAGALGELGDPRAIPTLDAMVAWSDLTVSLRAVDALARIARPDGVPALLRALDDGRPRLRSHTEAALRALHEDHPRLSLVKLLLRRLPEAEHKVEPTRLVAELGGAEARPGLFALMAGSDDETIVAVLDGLRALSGPEDGLVFSELLRTSRSDAVQRKCALLLGTLKYKPIIRCLMDLMASAEGGLAKDAHWALRQITGLRLKDDPDLWDQWWKRGGADLSGPQDG